jgi:hypothetical protein
MIIDSAPVIRTGPTCPSVAVAVAVAAGDSMWPAALSAPKYPWTMGD